ncbi:S8 family serine peptidase (plasmid) [Streptomyces sp. FXJ1.172]|uniref:S8 family serine peptidase n=1 Tax=Streptomyces sp. FXJ1.172 TaxID=710705 RepID=UPI0023DD409A|nr:S8 family serine peptidase [Streptomyces sp. FXJ1.172]WEP00899.1 S8 family serine peptidase [Streptomyces sp. FXJ1.172]
MKRNILVPRGSQSTGTPRQRRPHTCASRLTAVAPVLGAALVLVPPTVAVADSAPVGTAPAASSNQIRLPLMPSSLTSASTACTKPSKVHVDAEPWAQQSLGLGRVGRYTTGSGITVGVVDTGVAPGAERLAGRVEATGGAAEDCVGHGTFVAGLIAASPSPGGGLSGVAPGARIVAERGTGQVGTAGAAAVAQGIRAAVQDGATVVDVSAALPARTQELTAALAFAADHDALVVAPAVPDGTVQGNGAGGSAAAADYWPAAADGVLSVLDVDINGARAQDAYVPLHADLAAPGSGITGIGPAGSGLYVGNGPSLAAAFVAGAAALVRAHLPELTAPQVAARLKGTAAPAAVPLLDPYNALSAVLPTTRPAPGGSSTAVHLAAPAEESGSARRAVLLGAGCALLALLVGAGAALARVHRSRRAVGEGLRRRTT